MSSQFQHKSCAGIRRKIKYIPILRKNISIFILFHARNVILNIYLLPFDNFWFYINLCNIFSCGLAKFLLHLSLPDKTGDILRGNVPFSVFYIISTAHFFWLMHSPCPIKSHKKDARIPGKMKLGFGRQYSLLF